METPYKAGQSGAKSVFVSRRDEIISVYKILYTQQDYSVSLWKELNQLFVWIENSEDKHWR